jgi:hypothetical protein
VLLLSCCFGVIVIFSLFVCYCDLTLTGEVRRGEAASLPAGARAGPSALEQLGALIYDFTGGHGPVYMYDERYKIV